MASEGLVPDRIREICVTALAPRTTHIAARGDSFALPDP